MSRDWRTQPGRDSGYREREATVMGRHATGYSDEEIRQIAEYFSKQ
jgi:cytochrome c553